jgi:hypothetical protein
MVKVEPGTSGLSALPVPVPDLPALPTMTLPDEAQVTTTEPELEDAQIILDAPQPAKKARCSVPDIDDWLQDVVFMGETQVPATDVVRQEAVKSTEVDAKLSALQWWEKHSGFYQYMSILAKKYLCVPASSVPSERVFSLAGYLVSKKRARLSNFNVDMIIFLNKNMDYW